MENYQQLVAQIVLCGEERTDRTGVGTRSRFGESLVFDLKQGFPATTTKKLQFTSVVKELLWFLRGETNIESLGCGIWDDWADENGDVGPVYGYQWRTWPTVIPTCYDELHKEDRPVHYIDQINRLVHGLRKDPYSRRHILTAWNPGMIDQMGLPPCHMISQFYVSQKNELHCIMFQRSADVFLGVPFNIASYALLTHMLAQVSGLTAGTLRINFGDVHLYTNHLSQAAELLSRNAQALPLLQLNTGIRNIDCFELGDFELVGYDYAPAIRAPIAV